MNKSKQAFTLVELIVVITILAILGTIAFISLQGYSASSRDSVRISDVSNMKTSLELFHLNAGKYPLPDDYGTFTYSGEDLFYQGYCGDNVIQNVSRNMSEVPTDPLTERKYIYSVSSNKNELEILSLLETDDIALNTISQTKAAGITVIPRITGNYNGLFIKTPTYIVPLPSIINTEVEESTISILDSNNIQSMVTHLGTNIPDHGNIISNTGSLTGLILTGALNNLTQDSTDAEKASVMQAIQAAYTSSILATDDIYAYILSKTTTEDLAALVDTVILGGSTLVVSISTEDTPSGPLIDQTTCESANWMRVYSNFDVYIGTTQGGGFCISPRFGDWQTNGLDQNDGAGGISWNGWGDEALDYRNGWNASSIDDSGNPNPQYGQTRILDSESPYSCRALGTASFDFDTEDTIVGRMKWLATAGNTYVEARSIDWITGVLVPTIGITNPHAIPALYIADCIDGVKDLGTTMTYTHKEDTISDITYAQYTTDNEENTDTAFLSDVTFQDRQKYLTAWTQKSGSHLPSAMSHITDGYASATDDDGDLLTTTSRGEYQMACDNGLLTDSSDSAYGERIWLSAIGFPTGIRRGNYARVVGSNDCEDQRYDTTGTHQGYSSARFVVRP
ncbi:MAG: type II secretion system protein [Candidatus Gracilibacteria bacterium]